MPDVSPMLDIKGAPTGQDTQTSFLDPILKMFLICHLYWLYIMDIPDPAVAYHLFSWHWYNQIPLK